MAKKSSIKYFTHHFDVVNLEQIDHGQSVSNGLMATKKRLESTIRQLNYWSNRPRPSNCEIEFDHTEEDRVWMRPGLCFTTEENKPSFKRACKIYLEPEVWFTNADQDHVKSPFLQ